MLSGHCLFFVILVHTAELFLNSCFPDTVFSLSFWSTQLSYSSTVAFRTLSFLCHSGPHSGVIPQPLLSGHCLFFVILVHTAELFLNRCFPDSLFFVILVHTAELFLNRCFPDTVFSLSFWSTQRSYSSTVAFRTLSFLCHSGPHSGVIPQPLLSGHCLFFVILVHTAELFLNRCFPDTVFSLSFWSTQRSYSSTVAFRTLSFLCHSGPHS